jgi:glycosyltransferase involved in cell wall biosynthesis
MGLFSLDPMLARAAAAAAHGGGPRPLISFVPVRFEDGAFSGVPRFDHELRRIFPDLISLRAGVKSRALLALLAARRPDTLVITCNEESLLVPESLRTIVVHHGCAQTHFDRDPTWRGRKPRRLCEAQRAMYARKNRWFVSAAAWTSREFAAHYGVPPARVIPHWVPPIEWPLAPRGRRPVVLGDFRDWNKGKKILPLLAAELQEFELRALQCTYETRQRAYQEADGYLSLSVSEGGSYAVCDAEAAGMPLVMTDVGNCDEFTHALKIPWQRRDDLPLVAATVRRALGTGRGPSFFTAYGFDAWASAWRDLVGEVDRSR